MSGTADVLRKARKVIENEADWCRGRLCSRDGRHCALGAVAGALGYTDAQLRAVSYSADEEQTYDIHDAFEDHPAVIALSKAVTGGDVPDVGLRASAVYVFNDREHHDRVLDLFDRAIAEAE